jgi:hypothetical protein
MTKRIVDVLMLAIPIRSGWRWLIPSRYRYDEYTAYVWLDLYFLVGKRKVLSVNLSLRHSEESETRTR